MASISVIIPTFNRADLLRRAVDSVLAQTVPVDEIIIVNDGSTDDTAAMLRRRYPAIKAITQTRRGVSAARNTGIKAAAGDWIALLDSDDAWRENKIARQLQALEQAPGHPLVHSDEIWIRDGRRINPMKKHKKTGGSLFRRCLPLCVISPSAVMARRSLFEEVGLFDESLPVCEDYDLWLRICARHPVLYIDEPLVIKYGGHPDQLSRQYWGMDRFRIRALEKIIKHHKISGADRRAAIDTLVEKLSIYLTGAKKRGNKMHVREFEALLACYAAEHKA